MSTFPVAEGNETTFPNYDKSHSCPVCGKHDVHDKNEHVKIHGGALLLEKETESGVQSAKLVDELQAFLFMDWESGIDSEIYAELEIARDVKKGQFHMSFCSTSCLREFLSSCVDSLENKIEAAKNA